MKTITVTVDEIDILAAMKNYGGSFVQQLAKLYEYADSENRGKIQNTWHEEWSMYMDFAMRDKQK